MKIDFVLVLKLDSEKRQQLFVQTMQSFARNTNKDLINRMVIIDDGSEVNIEVDDPLIKVIRPVSRVGVGGGKNLGVATHTLMGRGDMLYMLDGDVFFTPFWLEKMIDAYGGVLNDFKILGGGVHPYLQPRPNEQRLNVSSHDAISGWSWLLSYDTWDKYGKMADNALGTGQSEDWEYCQRIRNDGFLVGCIQPQVIAHCGVTNTEGKDIVGRKESEELAKSIASEAMLI